MRNIVLRTSGLVILLLLASGIPVAAQKTAGLTLPVSGNNNSFTGTATINRFVKEGKDIVAIGFVKSSSGTSFAGVAWSVTVSTDAGAVATSSAQAPAMAQLTRIAWSGQNGARLVPVQATSCGVLNISLGATSINIEGVQVSLPAIGPLTISGQSGTPIGSLVCAVNSIVSSVGGVVGDVAGVVNLLNSLLGSLTGALGGVAGGLGGVTGGLPGGA